MVLFVQIGASSQEGTGVSGTYLLKKDMLNLFMQALINMVVRMIPRI